MELKLISVYQIAGGGDNVLLLFLKFLESLEFTAVYFIFNEGGDMLFSIKYKH